MPTDPILSALVEQVACYQRLAKLAETQHDHVEAGRTEQLLEVLKSRQEVLDKLAGFERQLAAAKGDWPAYLAKLDPARRAQAEDLLAQTRALLEQITTSDKNDALVLQQRKLNIGRQIQQAAGARQLNRNYAAAAYGARPSGLNVKR